MIKLPLKKQGFAKEMKPKISGVDLTLEYDNIESSLCKVAVTCSKLLSKELYDKICTDEASSKEELNITSKDFLQRAMLHFAIYEHFPYLVTRITNDGVTVSKSETKTTVFKYQEEDLKNNLITTGWFWMNLLIQFLNENADDFEDWRPEENGDDLPIELSDFEKWVSVSDEYFFMMVKWIIREVWMECVLSRTATPEKTDRLARAVCYEVMGRACIRLAYMILPEPIRRDLNSEMGKNHSAQSDTYIREVVADQFLIHSRAYWTSWDSELQKKAMEDQQKSVATYIPPKNIITEDDSFCV